MTGLGKQLTWRGLAIGLWQISIPVFVFLWWHPVGYRSTRMAIVGLLVVIWGGALALWWNSRIVRSICFGSLILLLLVVGLPGRQPNPVMLRERYVSSLVTFEGTKYVWGGENKLGIDCSGLVRRGLIVALLRQGIYTANPSLIRQSYAMRWFDCTARALKNGYREQTRLLFHAPNIQTLDHTKLVPGDLAVTADGVHVLAYLGQETWIEADPGVGRVIKLRASDENPWLRVPVEIIRWRIFEVEH